MNKKDQQLLLQLARAALEARFKDTDPDVSKVGHLTQLKGCFVTLYANGKLRGCIGFPKPILPLYEQIITAAFEDPRFTPLTSTELSTVTIEISLLTRPELIKANPQDYPQLIVIGRDGLIIKEKTHSGILLPQVATEHHLNSEQFLEMLCLKANLEKHVWKQNDVKIYTFHAEIFKE